MRLKDFIASVTGERLFLIAKEGGYLTTIEFGYINETTKLILLGELAELINKNAMKDEEDE